MLTNVLDVVGALLLVLFAFLVWPPLAVLSGGVLCLLVSWRLSGGQIEVRDR